MKIQSWRNWARTAQAEKIGFHYPTSVEQVQAIAESCRKRKKRLKVVGAGHSFSPIARPEEEALSLQYLRGLAAVNHERMEACFYAGTYLSEAAAILSGAGMAFINMGDIQEQTVAGAVCTGTHGTGLTLQSLSAQVVEWTWVDGYGQLHTHRRGDDDLSRALSISLGLLGVIVAVTFKTDPLYSLHVTSERKTFEEAIEEWPDALRLNRHYEWFYFPGEKVSAKQMNKTSLQKQSRPSKFTDFLKNDVIETAGFSVLSEICRLQPALSKRVNKISSANMPVINKTGLYHEIFPSPRRVKFTETEYAVSLDDFESIMKEIHTFLTGYPFHVHFPIECRVTDAEDAFLSPTGNRQTAFIAFHMYKGMPYKPYFTWAERLMKKYGGRPHFGKMHSLRGNEIRKLYPDLDLFLSVRQQFDPENMFMNAHTEKLLL